MKTNVLIFILLVSTLAQAQDFRALPPSEQPNGAELAYFDGKHPNQNFGIQLANDAETIVLGFLNSLTNGQLEAANQSLADDFRAYSPGFDDSLEAKDLLAQWADNGRLFADQHLTIETVKSVTVADSGRRGQWVFIKAVWSALDKRYQCKPVRIAIYELAHVRNNKILKTYTSYGNDQLFYDLGFPLYTTRPEVTQNR